MYIRKQGGKAFMSVTYISSKEQGLSLIESAMVLSLAATITAGVMFYYQSTSDSNKTLKTIEEVMTVTSAINGLYIGQKDYNNLSSLTLLGLSAIPDSYKKGYDILNPFGGRLEVSTYSQQTKYKIKLTNLPKEACVRLSTQNLGTAANGYAINPFNGDSDENKMKKRITPNEASDLCSSGDTNSVTFFMK